MDDLPTDLYVNYVKELQNETKFLNFETISTETVKDELLERVCRYVELGWPAMGAEPELLPYFVRRTVSRIICFGDIRCLYLRD